MAVGGADQELRAGVMVNGVVDNTGGTAKTFNATNIKPTNSSSSGIMNLSENEQISLYVLNWDAATDIVVTAANLTIIWISN